MEVICYGYKLRAPFWKAHLDGDEVTFHFEIDKRTGETIRFVGATSIHRDNPEHKR